MTHGSVRRAIFLWDLPGAAPSGQPLRLEGHVPETISVSADGRLAASVDGQGTFVVWDLETRRPITDELRGPDPSADLAALFELASRATGEDLVAKATTFQRAVFSPDGTRLATVSFDSQVAVWDTLTLEAVGRPRAGDGGPVSAVAFSPDGTLLATGDLAGRVTVWDSASGAPRRPPFAAHNVFVESIAFSPDGSVIATGGGDHTVALWNVRTSDPIGPTLGGHTASVVNVAFAPDGLTLASAGSDGLVQLWDVATGLPLVDPQAWHYSHVQALVFDTDGTRLATGSSDGSAFWDVDPTSWARSACEIANRNLTQTEWSQFLSSPSNSGVCS